MIQGEESVNTLTESFTTLVGKVSIIGDAAEKLAGSSEKNVILINYHSVFQSVFEQVQPVIVAFQFYDRMTQQLDHVSHSPCSLAQLIKEPDRQLDPYEQKGLQKTIQSHYTNKSDRVLFEDILNGASVEDALKMARVKAEEFSEDDIEFF